MEKRSKRIYVSLNTELIPESGKGYSGIITDLSEDGVGVCVQTFTTETTKDFITGTRLELRFQLHSGETINLYCEVVWLYSYKLLSFRISNNIGVRILNSPPEYNEFLKTL